MNHSQFLEAHLSKLSDRNDDTIKNIIKETLLQYKRNDYTTLDDLIYNAEFNIKIYLTINPEATVNEFANALNISKSTARKKLSKMDNVTCIKTKKPYIYKKTDN